MPHYLPFNAEGWRGLVLAGWEDVFAKFDTWLAESEGARIVNLPSRQVWRTETPKGVVFVKVIYRASEVKGPLRGTFASLKWLLRPSRALATLRISESLLNAGFECPVPVLAARRRTRTGWPVDVFISAERRETNLYDQMLGLGCAEIKSLLNRVAPELNRFHRAGFVHGDCISPNLALNEAGRLIFFDNDRTSRAPLFRPRYAQRRNLIQFGHRLTNQLGSTEYFEFFLENYVAAGSGAAAGSREILGIHRAVRDRQRTAR
ncbi:lipopolysaccharide kinase InaA family protein [Pseudomonas flexibilis]|uniref:lipopolysaccharide kinase InaA family protein n=1 Tax=Pseudomonas flexibilis TaxID=706570 RepID=UPI0008770254|nr:lipopolysaccharide kinase InaA family protein [Pseudomonas flexibilis]SCY01433.1 Lipopolysaccharide kinase (Kdo/WaaP) family protein [Pseudomonas flexibilis]